MGTLSARTALIIGLALLPSALSTGPRDAHAQEGEWERPWGGVLPGPAQGSEVTESEWFAFRVRDAVTGEPVAGATLTRTPEWLAEWRRKPDHILSVATTDADGLAWVPTHRDFWTDDCHWQVTAPGYAPHHEYGAFPDWDIALERGTTLRGRVIDPLGRPIAATVEYLPGCSHGTAAATATADSTGAFALRNIEVHQGQLWITGDGIAADLYAADSVPSLGSRPGVIVAEAGSSHTGRIVDLLGKPVADAVVRCFNEQRGPTAVSDQDGRFVIHGAEQGDDLFVYGPAELASSERYTSAPYPGYAAHIVLSPLGVVPIEDDAQVIVRVADGPAPTEDEPWYVDVVSTATGRSSTAEIGKVTELPHGAFRVFPGTFGAVDFDPVDGTVATGDTRGVVLRVRPNPILRISGIVPDGADVSLAAGHAHLDTRGAESGELVDSEDDTPVHVPRIGRLVLMVTPDGGPPFVFAAGPERDGVREVVVDVPPPHRVVLPPGAETAGLTSDGVAVLTTDQSESKEGTNAELATWAEGVVRLSYYLDDVEREIDIDLSTEPGGIIQVDDTKARAVDQSPDEFVAPLGTAALELRITDAEGNPTSALVLLDGDLHAAPEGTLAIILLTTGAHRLLVCAPDEPGSGKQLRIVLSDGESRSRTVMLQDE